MPERRPGAGLRRLVAERAGHRCEYCLIPARIATQSFTIEHILPWSAGGPTTAANLALACPGCNAHKMTRTAASDPLTHVEAPLFHPRKMRWGDHFAWSADGLRLVGLTAAGRVSVEQLQLNRSGLVALREMLILAGQHPPVAD